MPVLLLKFSRERERERKRMRSYHSETFCFTHEKISVENMKGEKTRKVFFIIISRVNKIKPDTIQISIISGVL